MVAEFVEQAKEQLLPAVVTHSALVKQIPLVSGKGIGVASKLLEAVGTPDDLLEGQAVVIRPAL